MAKAEPYKILSNNKKAYFDYFVEEKYFSEKLWKVVEILSSEA